MSQVSLKESTLTQKNLESQVMSVRGSDSNREYRIKELEGSLRALEQENSLLRQKVRGQRQPHLACFVACGLRSCKKNYVDKQAWAIEG